MTALPHAQAHRGGEVGNFEAHVGAHVIPTPESEGGHWAYTGRLKIAEVRRFLVATLDRDATVDEHTHLRASCGKAGCVRPDHLETRP